jgi:peptidoglycan/LPS O-acetylase OafA/YrhL
MEAKSRYASLDLARFIACMIVFFGHLVFLPQNFEYSSYTRRILSPIMVGDTAVLFFFALSGYVLSSKNFNESAIRWISKRFLRLYPVYFVAWILGAIAIYLRSPELLNRKVLVFGIIGFQSVDPKISLVVNAPLWSLSVEIIYAFVLYFLIRFQAQPAFLLLVPLGQIAWFFYPWSPLARALSFFVIGIFLRSEQVSRIVLPQKKIKNLLILMGIWFLSWGAYQILELPNSSSGEIAKLLLVSSIIFLVSKVEIRGKWAELSIKLGERSFCIYAFHYPVLLAFHHFFGPHNLQGLILYFTSSIFFSFLLAELAYRVLDKPSHRIARNL